MMMAFAVSLALSLTAGASTGMPHECAAAQEETTFAMVLDKLRHQLPLKALGNSSMVANLVREVGLVRDWLNRPLYGWQRGAGSEKDSVHTRFNFGMFQLPEQVGCMLSELASLPAHHLRTFVEIGAWYGWTGLFFAGSSNQATRLASRTFEPPASMLKTNARRA